MKYLFDNKEQPISGIKRSLTLIKKKSGVQASYNTLMLFLGGISNFEIRDAISIYGRYVEYALEINQDQEHVMNVLQDHFIKYSNIDFNENIEEMARLYSNLSYDIGLSFINEQFNKQILVESKINLLFLKSDLLCNLKQYDKAFKTLRQASDLSYHTDLSGSLGYKSQIAFRMADIGKFENKGDDYLNFSIDGWLYEAACLLTHLPFISPYFIAIEKYENKEINLYEEELFASACIKYFGSVENLNNNIIVALKRKMFPVFGISSTFCNEQIMIHISLEESRSISETIADLKVIDVLSRMVVLISDVKGIKLG